MCVNRVLWIFLLFVGAIDVGRAGSIDTSESAASLVESVREDVRAAIPYIDTVVAALEQLNAAFSNTTLLDTALSQIKTEMMAVRQSESNSQPGVLEHLKEMASKVREVIGMYNVLANRGDSQAERFSDKSDALVEFADEEEEDQLCWGWELIEDKSTVDTDECSDTYTSRLYNTHDNVQVYPELSPFVTCGQHESAQYMYVKRIYDPLTYNDYKSAILDCFHPDGFCPGSVDHLSPDIETWQEGFYFFNGIYYGLGPYTRYNETLLERLNISNTDCKHDSLVLSGANRWRIGYRPTLCEYNGENFFYRRAGDIDVSCNRVPICDDVVMGDEYEIYRRTC